MKSLKDRILKGMPKKYHAVLKDVEVEGGLVDDCKYMLYFTDEFYTDDFVGSCYPVRTFKEAREMIKDVYEVKMHELA